jgi:hypothetical protein
LRMLLWGCSAMGGGPLSRRRPPHGKRGRFRALASRDAGWPRCQID